MSRERTGGYWVLVTWGTRENMRYSGPTSLEAAKRLRAIAESLGYPARVVDDFEYERLTQRVRPSHAQAAG